MGNAGALRGWALLPPAQTPPPPSLHSWLLSRNAVGCGFGTGIGSDAGSSIKSWGLLAARGEQQGGKEARLTKNAHGKAARKGLVVIGMKGLAALASE